MSRGGIECLVPVSEWYKTIRVVSHAATGVGLLHMLVLLATCVNITVKGHIVKFVHCRNYKSEK
jgi:hypothetical protein